MQNKFRTKFIYKQKNINISNSMSIAVNCALMPLLHGNAQQTNIQNLKPDAASTVLFSLRKHAFLSTCSYDFGVQQKAYHK